MKTCEVCDVGEANWMVEPLSTDDDGNTAWRRYACVGDVGELLERIMNETGEDMCVVTYVFEPI